MQNHRRINIADGYVYSDFIFPYGKYLDAARGVVKRVCLPAGSTVTHDFAGRRGAAIRKSPVRSSARTTDSDNVEFAR